MRHNRLKLLVPEDSATTTDGTTELPAAPATSRPVTLRLHLVDADEGAPPDDAA
jgi:hypothetical protein